MYRFINRLSTETKFHFNQFIAQLGFIVIAIVGYKFHDSLNILIALNIVFAILFFIINHLSNTKQMNPANNCCFFVPLAI